MADQAERLRQISRQSGIAAAGTGDRKPCRVVAVSSGKGGVGKTNLVVNLSLVLIQWNYEVVIIDADLGLANVDVLINAIPRYSLADVINGTKEIQDIIVYGPQKLKVVPGGSGFMNLANLDHENRNRLIDRFRALEYEGNFMFIDTGAGISRNVLSFIAAADEFIIITTPEPTALTDAYGMIKVVTENNYKRRVNVVVNLIRDIHQGQEIFDRLERVSRRYLPHAELNYLGGILYDPVVSRSVEECRPFVLGFPKSGASQSVGKIAKRFIQQDKSITEPKGVRGFLSRLTSLIK